MRLAFYQPPRAVQELRKLRPCSPSRPAWVCVQCLSAICFPVASGLIFVCFYSQCLMKLTRVFASSSDHHSFVHLSPSSFPKAILRKLPHRASLSRFHFPWKWLDFPPHSWILFSLGTKFQVGSYFSQCFKGANLLFFLLLLGSIWLPLLSRHLPFCVRFC